MPTVSIILPTYKEPPHIKKSIDSVFAQSFTDWELIVVDDGLVNNTRQIVDGYVSSDKRIKVVTNSKNLGIQKSLNNGLLIATGKYIARIDHDDQWIDKDKLKKQVDFLDNNPDYVLVGTDAVICDSNFMDLQTYSMPKSDLEIRHRILFKNCFLHSAILARKNTIKQAGLYTEGKKVLNVEDFDLWLRLGCVGKMCNIDLISVRIMVHDDTITAKNRMSQSRKNILLAIRYRREYPYFYFALMIGCLRFIFFSINSIFPFPRKVLYKIQAMYKAI